mgnify:CR=1 FL=1
MATQTDKGKGTESKPEAKAEATAAPADEKFTVEQFIENAEALGLDSPTVVGAFHGVDRDAEYSLPEVKDKVGKWLATPVKQEDN